MCLNYNIFKVKRCKPLNKMHKEFILHVSERIFKLHALISAGRTISHRKQVDTNCRSECRVEHIILAYIKNATAISPLFST